MCDCRKHFNPVAKCTCKCDHGKTFKDIPEDNTLTEKKEEE